MMHRYEDPNTHKEFLQSNIYPTNLFHSCMEASDLILSTETNFNRNEARQPLSSVLIDGALPISSLTTANKLWATAH